MNSGIAAEIGAAAPKPATDRARAVAAVEAATAAVPAEMAEGEAPLSEGPPPDLDEVAESSYRAEARERGEVVAPTAKSVELAEETDSKQLPPLNDLVQRIPAEVRETLEDLFRAKFIAVKRVPKSALKS